MQTPDWFTQAIRHPTRSQSLTVHNADVHFRTWNAEATKPGLLFVHGYGAHSHWWDFIAPMFLEDYRVAAMDMTGAGDSSHRGIYTARGFGDEIRAVAGALADDTIIVGHSFGGTMTRIAAWLQVQGQDTGQSVSRDAISGIVIVDSAISDQRVQRAAPPPPRSRERAYPSLEQGVRRFRLRPAQPCSNTYILDHIARHSLKQTSAGYQFKLDQGLFSKMPAEAVPLPDSASMLGQISIPIGAIFGAQSALLSQRTLELLAPAVPEARVKIIEDARHHVFLDQPLAFIDALQQVLATLKD